MPQPVPCDLGCGAEYDVIVTNRHNGDTIALSMDCIPAWAETIALSLEQLAQLAEPEPTNGVAIEDPHAPKLRKAPSKAQRARRGRGSPTPPEDHSADPGASQGPEDGAWTTDPDGYASPTSA